MLCWNLGRRPISWSVICLEMYHHHCPPFFRIDAHYRISSDMSWSLCLIQCLKMVRSYQFLSSVLILVSVTFLDDFLFDMNNLSLSRQLIKFRSVKILNRNWSRLLRYSVGPWTGVCVYWTLINGGACGHTGVARKMTVPGTYMEGNGIELMAPNRNFVV